MLQDLTEIDGNGGVAAPAPGADIDTGRIDRFLAERRPATPCLVIDRTIVEERYRAMGALFPEAQIYYAIKANPAPEIIACLAGLGARFDLASAGEKRICDQQGVPPARCSFGNTIKREAEIAEAHSAGIDLFAFDSPGELEKLARAAPGARVFCRIMVPPKGADWPLSGKFGCSMELAIELLLRARGLGLRPAGLSFHVGSQQTDPMRWVMPIRHAAAIFAACARHGLRLELLNLGGGFPGQYSTPVPPLGRYAEVILDALERNFGHSQPLILLEPGRHLVADAGILRSTILLIARKSHHAGRRWLYLDAGRYNGLPETLDERIRYRLRATREDGALERVILAGPTCDSTDIIYRHADYRLPLDIAVGDTIDFLSAGAYTASYASVAFNGFAPLATCCL